jgi:hypothetical protein
MYFYRFEIIIFSWPIMILSYEEWNYLDIVANNNYDGFFTTLASHFHEKFVSLFEKII